LSVPITTTELIERYDIFLLDAYGVLVHDQGPLPGAIAFLETLRSQDKRFLILSNDASRSLREAAARYRDYGFQLSDDDVLTSGSLVGEYIEAHGLAEAPHCVIGREEARDTIAPVAGPEAERFDDAGLIIVAGTVGIDLLGELDDALSGIGRRLERGEKTHLLLPNPDLIYPKKDGGFGYTAGAIALLLEQALAIRFPDDPPSFVRLGKPHSPIFDAARSSVGRGNAVMIGDQLATDIAGAHEAGIDSVLVTTGVARTEGSLRPAPTWILDGGF